MCEPVIIQVIARLQAYVAHFTGQQSTTESATQTDAILEGPAAAALMYLTSQQGVWSDTSHQAITLSSAELQAACTAKDHRIAALEKQLVEAARNASREISELKMQLFDMELKLVMAGVPTSDGGNSSNEEFHVRDDLELPVIVPSLPIHRSQHLSARSDHSGLATRRTISSHDSNLAVDRPGERRHNNDSPLLSGRSSHVSPRSIHLVQSGRVATPPRSRGEETTESPAPPTKETCDARERSPNVPRSRSGSRTEAMLLELGLSRAATR